MTEGGESKDIHWTIRLEEYFVQTGEKANCLAWVHKKAEELYSVRKTFIDLPVIVGSGVIAFLNAGSQSMFEDARISSIALGVGSLVVGIMNTMGTYFGWAKRAEGHRISAINYAKLYRFIAVELSLPREERMNPNDFLKVVKDTYDRLAEISPMIPPSVIHKFQRRFKKVSDIAKPEEANGLHKIQVYRRPGDDVGSPDVRVKIGTIPETFSVKNPMLAVKKDEIPSRPSVESLEEIEKSVAMPTLPEEVLKEAKEAPSS
jgi:hypothetical protein